MTSLNNKARTETEPVGAEELARRYQLSTKLYAGNEVNLTHPECTLLQERVAKLYEASPMVVGRIWDLLEEREPEPTKE